MPPQPPRYSPELRRLAVRMVAEVRADYASEWAAICAVASKLGVRSPGTLRRWLQQDAQQESSTRRRTSKWGFLKRWLSPTRAVVSAILVTVLGGLALAYTQSFAGFDKHRPQVELDQLSTSPGNIDDYSSNGASEEIPFKIDIKLINSGMQIAVVNDARLVIQKFVKIPECASQGAFPATGNYVADMPTDPRPGSVVNVPVSQLAQSDGADRFNISLRIPPQLTTIAEDPVYLYLVRIYLYYNGNKSIDIGRVLVDLPFDPAGGGAYFWTKGDAGDPGQFEFLGAGARPIEQCLINNSYALRSILSSSAVRTRGLAIIPRQLAFLLRGKA